MAAKYAGVAVRKCQGCEGHLVRRNRAALIKLNRQKTDEELLAELASPHAVDTRKALSCPSCLALMAKQLKKVGPENYMIDVCSKCDHIWFDAGELAKLQLQFGESENWRELERFRRRHDDPAPPE